MIKSFDRNNMLVACMCVREQSVPGSGPQGERCRGQYSRIKWYYPEDNLPKCPWLWLLYSTTRFGWFSTMCQAHLLHFKRISQHIFMLNHHRGCVRMYTNMFFVDMGNLALWSCWHLTGSCPTQHAHTNTVFYGGSSVSDGSLSCGCSS